MTISQDHGRLGFWASARLLLRCFTFLEKFRIRYITGLVFSACELALLFSVPVMNEKLVDLVTGQQNENTFKQAIFLFIAFLLLAPLVAMGKYYLNTANSKGAMEMRKAMFARMQDMPVSSAAKHKLGDYVARMTTDVNRVVNVFQFYTVIRLVKFFVVVCVSVVLLLRTDWRFALLGTAFGLISLLLSTVLNPYVQRLESKARVHTSLASSFLIEVLRGLSVVRVFLLEGVLSEKFDTICDNIRLNRETFRTMNGIAFGVIDFFIFAAQAVGFATGMIWVTQGTVTLAKCVFASSLISLLADGVHQFSEFLLIIQPSIVSAKRVFDVLDAPVERLGALAGAPDVCGGCIIRLNNVSFSYGDGKKVIDRLSLEIHEGEKLAVVGSSGSGKTTLMKLLMGLYEPDEGGIFYSGVNSRELSLQDIRSRSAYVAQECMMLDGSIRDNIKLGNLQATDEEMISAAGKANIHAVIAALPDGYDTVAGERGARLSGGQRQRISIARAILKNAPILLLDEATSALDSEAEQEVLKGLENLTRSRTVVSIAHRLSTIQTADRIVVLEEGRIGKNGTSMNSIH